MQSEVTQDHGHLRHPQCWPISAPATLGGLALLTAFGACLPAQGIASRHAAPTSGAARIQPPLAFERNLGQTDAQVKYLARGSGYTLFLTPTEAVLSLRAGRGGAAIDARRGRDSGSVLRFALAGAQKSPRASVSHPLPGKSHYLRGSDPSKWQRNVPQFGSVKYSQVWKGVDLVYYGAPRSESGSQSLEYDFAVAPNVDPDIIKLSISGAKGAKLDASGDLVLQTSAGELRQRRPIAYQVVKGRRKNVDAAFSLQGGKGGGTTVELGFKLSAYDPKQALTIDPVLVYSTYLGGTVPAGSLDETDAATAIAVDAQGSAYVTGSTTAVDFPTTPGSFSPTIPRDPVTNGTGQDAFVTKLSPDGGTIVYSTYLGGSVGGDDAVAIDVDSSGSACIFGGTASAAAADDEGSVGFPVTANAFQREHAGGAGAGTDGFVTKLSPDGGSLLYSTFLGGTGDENFYSFGITGGIAVDAQGAIYVAGHTNSTDFPTLPGSPPGWDSIDAFVAKINPFASGTASLVYSRYLGGSLHHDFGSAIAVDALGAAYVAGMTIADDFPVTAGAVAYPPGSPQRAFITKFTPAGAVAYSGILGNGDAHGVAVDSSGAAYVTGQANDDFPTTPGAFMRTLPGPGHGAFVTKVTPNGSTRAYSTLLGGSFATIGFGIRVDHHGCATVAGLTLSTDFPGTGTPQPANAGGGDVFIVRLKPSGAALLYATYLGGSADESPQGIVGLDVDEKGASYVAGYTVSTNFPLAANAPQSSRRGTQDSFIAKISPTLPTAPQPVNATAVSTTQVNVSWTITTTTQTWFQIERRTADTVFVVAGTVGASATQFQDTGRTPNTTYFYRARAVNECEESPWSVEVSATTLSGPPPTPGMIKVAPAKLNFATVSVGKTRVKSFTIKNTSTTGSLQITVGAPPARYTVTAGGGTATIPPRGSRKVSVSFAPTASGAVPGTLLITSNDPARPSVTVTLTGKGKTKGR